MSRFRSEEMGLRVAILLLAVVGLAACPRPPAEMQTSAAAADPAESGFSAERAFQHLERLVEMGPRAAGTPGAARAREYLRAELEATGLAVTPFEVAVELDDGTPLRFVSLIAVVPGASPDLVVLAAPYDTRHFASFDFVGANGGASGPALLLELARALSERPLPYTTWLVFLEGEAPLGRGNPEEATTAWIASTELASQWARDGRLESIRLLLYFDRVADADLRIARDLRSHRSYREVFWDVARRLELQDAFVPGQHLESPSAGHLPFLSRGLRRSVLVMDTSFGGDEPPGIYADTEDDTPERCSQESLGAVGQVSLRAIHEIAERLAKIDRFADAPLARPMAPLPTAPRPAPLRDRSGAESAPEEPTAPEPSGGAELPVGGEGDPPEPGAPPAPGSAPGS